MWQAPSPHLLLLLSSILSHLRAIIIHHSSTSKRTVFQFTWKEKRYLLMSKPYSSPVEISLQDTLAACLEYNARMLSCFVFQILGPFLPRWATVKISWHMQRNGEHLVHMYVPRYASMLTVHEYDFEQQQPRTPLLGPPWKNLVYHFTVLC